MPNFKNIFAFFCAGFAALACASCAQNSKPTLETAKISDAQKTSYTLFEERLGKLVKETEILAQEVAQKKTTPLEARLRLNELADTWAEFAAEHPDSLETQILYGKFLRSARYDEAAYKVFLRADKIDPNIAVIKQQLSTYETEQKQFLKAYAHIKEAAKLEPQTAAYQAQLGEFLAAYGGELLKQNALSAAQKDAEMLDAFKAASQIEKGNPDFLARYAQACTEAVTPDLEKAEELWQKAEAAAPLGIEKDEMRLALARVQIMKSDFFKARETLAKIRTPEFFRAKEKLENKILEIEKLNSQSPKK